MKENMTRTERFSDTLADIREDLLEEAIRIDSAQKLRTARRRERMMNYALGKTVAVAASIVLIAGLVTAIPHLNHVNNGSETHNPEFSTTESSTAVPNPEEVHPVKSAFNFDSVGEIADFLIAVKASQSAYEDYCQAKGFTDPLPMEKAEKIADSILLSDYHIRLKDGFTVEGFSALYTDDGNGILRLSFTVGQTQYVFSHFYGMTSTEDHGQDSVIGETMLGEIAVPVFIGENHVFVDAVFGNTRIYAAAFTDHADGLFSEFEIVPTSDAFKK